MLKNSKVTALLKVEILFYRQLNKRSKKTPSMEIKESDYIMFVFEHVGFEAQIQKIT